MSKAKVEEKPQLILSIDTSSSIPNVSVPQSINTSTVSKSAPGRRVAADNAAMDKDEKAFVDEFGFQLRDEAAIEEELRYVHSIDGDLVKRREMKWESMTKDWNRANEQQWDKIKSRCRKGIPNRLRGMSWQMLLGSRAKLVEHAGVYQQLIKKMPDEETASVIERDLARTFPSHALFREEGGVGQQQLRNILHAYAAVDPEVNYCQGLGFIVATLLTQMSEEEAFWSFHEMMQQNLFAVRELFRPNFPMLQLCFYQLKRLMTVFCPKVLEHLESLGLDVSIFASQWFMTLFVYHFPFRAVLRVWDIFLCEGWKIVFRVAISLLKQEEANIVGQPIDVAMKTVRTISDNKSPDDIINRAMAIKFKTEVLLEYRKEYETWLRLQHESSIKAAAASASAK